MVLSGARWCSEVLGRSPDWRIRVDCECYARDNLIVHTKKIAGCRGLRRQWPACSRQPHAVQFCAQLTRYRRGGLCSQEGTVYSARSVLCCAASRFLCPASCVPLPVSASASASASRFPLPAPRWEREDRHCRGRAAALNRAGRACFALETAINAAPIDA